MCVTYIEYIERERKKNVCYIHRVHRERKREKKNVCYIHRVHRERKRERKNVCYIHRVHTNTKKISNYFFISLKTKIKCLLLWKNLTSSSIS